MFLLASWSFVNGLLNHVVKELNVKEALKWSILVVQKAAAVPLSWSFLNGLLNHVVKELNVEEVLKSPFLSYRRLPTSPTSPTSREVSEFH